MIEFRDHEGFLKETFELKRRFSQIEASLEHFKKLCESHFHPTNPQAKISPGKIHRVTQNDICTIWKTELPVIKANLRPNQYPRMWFAVARGIIVFLCIATHVDNYNNNEMDHLAISRVTDFF